MGLVSEFREFAVKGNAIDMAVGIIVGAGFGKIVASLVSDVIMPPVGMLLGGADFSNLKVVFRPEKIELVTAKVLESEVALRYGAFINTVLDFVIVAACVFLLVKGINVLRRAGEKAKA